MEKSPQRPFSTYPYIKALLLPFGGVTSYTLSPPFVTTSKLKVLPKYPAQALDLLVFGGDLLDLHFHQTDLESTHSSLGDLVCSWFIGTEDLVCALELW